MTGKSGVGILRRWRWALLAWLFAAAAQAEIVVRDDEGNEVRLVQPARRIVSLAPHATELLFAAGAGRSVVGAVQWSDYPPEAKKIPQVGSYVSPDAERILALAPDLAVGWASGNDPRVLGQLRDLKLTLYVTEIRTFEQVATNLERLGALAGTGVQAQKAAGAFRDRWRRLQSRYGGEPRVSVFYQIWDRPLMTVNGEHLISRVIELCGGTNVFASVHTLTPVLNVESVLVANPQVIVAGGMGEAYPEWLEGWRRWPQIEAVKQGNLVFVPSDLLQRPTPRILDGAERLCQALDAVRSRSAHARK
ncbi:MAG: cobalamin-binding protein [Burkholderiales bacterium]|nr:MAG: cobalamin-binding protein [Burkholderiales bacterium]